MEVGVTFELVAHERLHGLQVLFIESLSHQIEDLKALLVRNRAELECSCHVEHSLNDLLAKDVVQTSGLADGASLGQNSHQDAHLLDSANS